MNAIETETGLCPHCSRPGPLERGAGRYLIIHCPTCGRVTLDAARMAQIRAAATPPPPTPEGMVPIGRLLGQAIKCPWPGGCDQVVIVSSADVTPDGKPLPRTLPGRFLKIECKVHGRRLLGSDELVQPAPGAVPAEEPTPQTIACPRCHRPDATIERPRRPSLYVVVACKACGRTQKHITEIPLTQGTDA